MITPEKIEETARDQLKIFRKKETGTLRELDFKKYLKTKQIVVVSGCRRSGKSTLLKQFSEKYKSFYYLNFDDERLVNFSVEDFQVLMLIFQKMYSAKTIFLDEIQNVPKWERFARRLFEEGYKVYLTGSNAKLLSSELATHLTGRYFKIELYPFSFEEFLKLEKINWKKIDSKKHARILACFSHYLNGGGFPEFLKTHDPEHLKRIYEDILYKDILTRFNIREVKSFRELAGFLFSNVGKEASYNGLKNTLGFKNVMSVKNYIQYMQETYLIFELFKYDWSLKKQYVSNKKIYAIDNGLRGSVAFSNSSDKGRMLENLVFLQFKRKQKEVFYFKDKKECDFIIKEKTKIIEAVQVTRTIDRNNEKRELDGLLEAMEKFNLKNGLIITESQEEERKIKGRKIKVMPAWKWLLDLE